MARDSYFCASILLHADECGQQEKWQESPDIGHSFWWGHNDDTDNSLQQERVADTRRPS